MPGPAKLRWRLPPIEPDPAVRVTLERLQDRAKLRQCAGLRKRLLDEHRLADGEAGQGLQRSVDLTGLRVHVHAEDVELGCDLVRHESGRQAGSIQTPIHQPYGDQVHAIVMVDRLRQVPNPLPSDTGAGPFGLIERNELHLVILAGEGRPQPFAGTPPSAGYHRLVQPYPEDPIALPQPRALHRHPENGQLLAERQVLGGDGSTRHEKRSQKERDNGYDAQRQASVWVL
jgi:hypothetical protein